MNTTAMILIIDSSTGTMIGTNGLRTALSSG